MYTLPDFVFDPARPARLFDPAQKGGSGVYGLLILAILGPGESAVDAYANMEVSYKLNIQPTVGGTFGGMTRRVKVPGVCVLELAALNPQSTPAREPHLAVAETGTTYRVTVLESPGDWIEIKQLLISGLIGPIRPVESITEEIGPVADFPQVPTEPDDGVSLDGQTAVRLTMDAGEGETFTAAVLVLAYLNVGLGWMRVPENDLSMEAGGLGGRFYGFPDQTIAVGQGQFAYRPAGPGIVSGTTLTNTYWTQS